MTNSCLKLLQEIRESNFIFCC